MTYLEHIAKNAENAVETGVLGVATLGAVSLPLHARHDLGNEDQVNDQRGSKEGVLADIEQADGLVPIQEDLGIVLVKSALIISNSGHVLDNDAVVRMLTVLVENIVGRNHVVHYVRLGDLLGAELLLRAEVHAVIVAKMIVAGNGGELDTGVDQEVNERGLHLSLSRLEIVTTDEGIVLLGELDSTRDERVLRRAVDEWSILEDGCDGKDSRRRDFLVASLDRLDQVVRGVVDALDDVGIALRVGGPLHNDLIKTVGGLEFANVLANLLDVGHGSLAALKDVVGTLLLVGSDEVGVVDARKGLHGSHLLADQHLQRRREHLGTVHGISKVHAADVPTTHNEVVGVNHGKKIMERNVDFLASLAVDSELRGRAHDDRSIVVGRALALLGLPDEIALVGDDTGGHSGTVVATPADKHDADLGDLAVDLEVIESLLGNGDILALGVLGDVRGAVGVLGLDGILGVLHVG